MIIGIVTIVLGLLIVGVSFYLDEKKAKAKIKEIIQPTLDITEENIQGVLETQMVHAMGEGPAHPAYVARTQGVK